MSIVSSGRVGNVRDSKVLVIVLSLVLACNARRLQDAAPNEVAQRISSNYEQKAVSRWYTNSELEAAFKNYVKRCKSIARMFTIGKSTKGVPLYVIEISNKPGIAEAEPNFAYIANIHGDEPGGRHVLLALAEWLCASYKKDKRATKLVDNMHLYLMPVMNPDGYQQNTRENWYGFDLNRNFPDPVLSKNLLLSSEQQPEVAAIMNWKTKTKFTGSAVMHEGALVVNYPYDGFNDTSMCCKANTSADDAAFQYLSKKYARWHKTMYKSQEFKDGITNGAKWYPIWGGSQDWSYLAVDCFELTLELSDQKTPPASALPKYWSDNKDAVIQYPLLATLGGLRGKVVDRVTQRPLAATISVKSIAKKTTAGKQFGDFYKPLAPGVYTVIASLKSYKSQKVTVIVPPSGDGVFVSFKMPRI